MPPLLGRQAQHALKALLEMAGDPGAWRSVKELAAAQALPAPMLEQLLLRLRRAGLLEARRGRVGGYRLARPAQAIPLAEVLTALGQGLGRDSAALPLAQLASQEATEPHELAGGASDRVAALLERRLRSALERELARCTLAELLFDLRSARAELHEEGGLLLG